MVNYQKKYLKYKKKYLLETNKMFGGEFKLKKACEIYSKFLKNKTKTVAPTFYIKYGPPASGKGTIMDKVAKIEQKNINNIVVVEIDTIIQEHEDYKKKRNELLEKLKNNEFNKEDINKELSDLYFKYRKNVETPNIKGDDISDSITYGAIEEGLDVAWETNGNDIDWTKNVVIPKIKKINNDYKIVIAYPLVPLEHLLERAHRREEETGQTPANNIEEMTKNAAKNILEMKKIVDTIYIYDNSGKKGEEDLLIKYSKNKAEICKCTDKYNTNFKSEEIKTMLSSFCNIFNDCNRKNVSVIELIKNTYSKLY
jgi:predicted ABC-type ATPase